MNSLLLSMFRQGSVLSKLLGIALGLTLIAVGQVRAGAVAESPLYLGLSAPALIMLTMERDHKLYYEAYNDASDVNGDGVLDVRYNPALPDPSDPTHVKIIDYAGYFDSHRCYDYASGIFVPVGKPAPEGTKKCSGKWSGDFLNYLTTSRMDAMRRVLYGGMRSTDTTTETVLERSHIPQDAHSWGKEYTSTAIDGYDIHDYTPLSQPSTGTRHLFANTTLLCPTGNSDPGCNSNPGMPLLRVLTNSNFRVWEWLSIERPVAGIQCATGNNSRTDCPHSGGNYDGYPSDAGAFAALLAQFATESHKFGSGTPSNGRIDGTGNPWGGDDYYLTVFSGQLILPESGEYRFSVDGDDAVEVLIDGNVVVGWYGGHGKCGTSDTCRSDHRGKITLSAGTHIVEFHHQERSGDDSYYLYWRIPSASAYEIIPANKYIGLTQTTYDVALPGSEMTDYVVRVQTCVELFGAREPECTGYPELAPTIYKPIGILQEYGSSADQMAFGLLTGSYAKSTSGGVLRKNISSFTDEFDPDTGIYTATHGLVWTINHLKTDDFGGNYFYNSNCGVPEVSGPLTEGRCRMWGNPVAEMMFEGLRYFAGESGPLSNFNIAASGNDDETLNLPLPGWKNPYAAGPSGGGFPQCSRPSQMVISDINPTNDTDQLPGASADFSPASVGSFKGMNVSSLADTIWDSEYVSDQTLFIGQSGSNYDGAPTAKVANSFGNIRGLSPEEPTKLGGYYAGSVALFGKTTDLNSASGDQKVDNYSVALASPLPRIVFPVGSSGQTVTLVPFGKTVGGCVTSQASGGTFFPTNTIVDFYVDTIKNTDSKNQDNSVNFGRAYAKFRINYEDSEYGSDHDMDAIVEYELTLLANNTVDVKLTSGYAAGGCIQHMGYVISGTTQDGIYLAVRDSDTTSDVDYSLDRPNTSGVALPLTATNNFTQGSSSSASFVKHDPLWYAAKWGGFVDADDDNKLDPNEWDTDSNGVPDTYFLVTNAGKLKKQLTNAFNEIVKRDSSSSSVATNSTSAGSDTLIFQARFNSGDWSGQIQAFQFLDGGVIGTKVWDTNVDVSSKFASPSSRRIYSYDPTVSSPSTRGVDFCWTIGCFGSGTTRLSDSQKQIIDPFSFSSGATSSPILNYLRGDASLEKRNPNNLAFPGNFRNRATSVLGDIVNSDPVFVGTQSFGYSDLPASASERSTYSAFVGSLASRKKMLYVGANDGMLHGFDSLTGVEQFAYVPNLAITEDLNNLALPGYQHRYFVDGSPTVGDAFLSAKSEWRTILVSTTGGGGRGVFALDITNPDTFNRESVLWEFGSSDDADLGTTIPQAVIARLANGHWGAIVANGYNSRDAADAADDRAVLFVLDLETGAKLAEIEADASAGNGLSTPVAVDVDSPPDRIADYVYAGDLKGNLWKFDLTDSNPSNWEVAYGGSPLYVATDTATPAVRQPITAKPVVGPISSPQTNGVMVYFGTGKYFEVGDNVLPTSPATPQVQTFYGIWDQCDKANSVSCNGSLEASGRTVLQQQEITLQDMEAVICKAVDSTTGDCTATVTANIRESSSNAVDYSDSASGHQKGWYMDLLGAAPDGKGAEGERVVTPAVLRGSRVIFATLVPSPNACEDGGTSWLMELNANSGQAPQSPVLDLNKDDKVDNLDRVPGHTGSPSGVMPEGKLGIFKSPTILECGGSLECKLLSGSSGNLGIVKESEAAAAAAAVQ